ncbi:hypothetical protein [Streptomyces sp. AN091965]|uniref:hypothetical protein n=1 Tax=Streptomyces sp. AN091965 TaxID=2927803 RepID=UPI001F61E3B9|nr:hypothetical protein [Streptomyces sp. AN091965]MCI3928850.1 hypothetical protein [Streptomyces sp. AN091965]
MNDTTTAADRWTRALSAEHRARLLSIETTGPDELVSWSWLFPPYGSGGAR